LGLIIAPARLLHRPLPDIGDGYWVKSPAITLAATPEEAAAEARFVAQRRTWGLADATEPPPLLLGLAQTAVSVVVSTNNTRTRLVHSAAP